MARFDDARVGDKVKAPALDRDAGRIVSIQEHEAEYPITINFPNYGHITITRDGKFSKYSLISATFYTNDAGELLTERPKRKVKRSWDFVVHGCTWDRDGFPKITLSVESIADLEQFRLTIGKPATLIVEVDE